MCSVHKNYNSDSEKCRYKNYNYGQPNNTENVIHMSALKSITKNKQTVKQRIAIEFRLSVGSMNSE